MAEGEGKRRRGRVCALDVGDVRVGVAVSDELRLYAHGRGVLPRKPTPELFAALAKLVAEEDVRRLVVGLPLDMKGGEGEGARKMRKLAQALCDHLGCEVELWDERLTTVEARRRLAERDVHGREAKARIDEESAVTLLQAWLDGPGRPRGAR